MDATVKLSAATTNSIRDLIRGASRQARFLAAVAVLGKQPDAALRWFRLANSADGIRVADGLLSDLAGLPEWTEDSGLQSNLHSIVQAQQALLRELDATIPLVLTKGNPTWRDPSMLEALGASSIGQHLALDETHRLLESRLLLIQQNAAILALLEPN